MWRDAGHWLWKQECLGLGACEHMLGQGWTGVCLALCRPGAMCEGLGHDCDKAWIQGSHRLLPQHD